MLTGFVLLDRVLCVEAVRVWWWLLNALEKQERRPGGGTKKEVRACVCVFQTGLEVECRMLQREKNAKQNSACTNNARALHHHANQRFAGYEKGTHKPHWFHSTINKKKKKKKKKAAGSPREKEERALPFVWLPFALVFVGVVVMVCHFFASSWFSSLLFSSLLFSSLLAQSLVQLVPHLHKVRVCGVCANANCGVPNRSIARFPFWDSLAEQNNLCSTEKTHLLLHSLLHTHSLTHSFTYSFTS